MLPLPDYVGVTPASNHDLSAFQQITPYIHDCEVYADKAYISALEKEFLETQNATLLTPVKKAKAQENLFWFEQLLSSSVSRVRQPIEALFSWIQEKTNIQFASRVRSSKGLMVHLFGRLATAFFLLAFNS